MGDSYVDHPSFGAAIITRVLEDCGYKVAVLSQPDWKNDADFLQFGKPRLGFFVTAGNIDIIPLQSVSEVMMLIRQAVKTASVLTEL